MLGKPVGSDSDQGKVTYATKVGLEKAQQDVELLTDKALESLRAFDDTDFLQALAQSLISRDHWFFALLYKSCIFIQAMVQ